MAEYLTITELRNYDVNGTTYDLAALVEAYELGREPGRMPESIGEVKVGQIVYAWVMGARYRRGVVTKVGRTKIHVAYTTQGAIDEAIRYRGGADIRVGVQAVALVHIRVIDTPAAPVETPAAEEAPEAPAATPAAEEMDEPSATAQAAAEADETTEDAPAPAGAAPAAGDLLRALEPEVGHLLPPLAAGKELVRVADIAPSFLLTLHSQAGKVGLNSEDDLEEPEMTATTTTETQTTEQTEQAKRDHTGSTIVALIEKVWDRIRAEHPELPAVVVTTGSGEFVKWGHFRPNSWKTVNGEKRHEFFLASEALAKGAFQVLQTTIHEAAHTLSNVRGQKDTSRQHRYHNGTFRKTAEELGLEHKAATPDKTHGFSFVTLTEATKTKYADLLAELDKELTLTGLLPFWLGGDADEDDKGGEKITKPKNTGEEGDGETKPQSGNLKATCGCEEPIIIRLSRKVLDLGVVRCDSCSELFTAA